MPRFLKIGLFVLCIIWVGAARAGNSEAEKEKAKTQTELGWSLVLQKDFAAAAPLLSAAAESGYADAQFRLGVLYCVDPVRPDSKKCMDWMSRAAEQQHQTAQALLGVIYLNGFWGVQIDRNRAHDLLRKSADAGQPMAQHLLGEEAMGSRDYAAAEKWLNLAVAQHISRYDYYQVCSGSGDAIPAVFERHCDNVAYSWAEARSSLGKLYYYGDSRVQNYPKALALLREAAEFQVADAERLLGDIYVEGLAVPRDYASAVKYYRLAAEHGSWEGRHKLAQMYKANQASPQDMVIVYLLYASWTPVSTDWSQQNAEEAERFSAASAAVMTPKQLATAQLLLEQIKAGKSLLLVIDEYVGKPPG